ncbi:MAG: hypothetical protein HKN68_12275 [Saprospiraceae bacterium]|nr:hypothetical protein [Saprospiraceae bacterium]
MNGDHFIQDYIDLYMSGGISDEEFQERLKNDPVLQRAYDAANDDKQLIKTLAKQDLKALAESELKEYKEKPKPVISTKRISAVAAVAVILFLIYFTYNNLNQSIDHNQLFVEYFEAPPHTSSRGSSESLDSWNLIIEHYLRGEYIRVIEELPSLLQDPNFNSDESAKLYLGISYLMENQYDNAHKWFQQVSVESTFIQDAEWYTAMTYLKEGEMDAAISTLNMIVDQPKHYKRKEALSLLDKL